jgi:hypothetical protein
VTDGSRILGLGDLGLLASDQRELIDGFGHAVLVLQGLADTHVDADLVELGQAQHVLAAELCGQRR